MSMENCHTDLTLSVNQPINKRIEWIDTAKFIAIFCVIYAHCCPSGDVISYLYSFHLPVFFLLNGMTLHVDGIDFGTFLVKKIKNYIIPMICLSVLINICAIYFNEIHGFKPIIDSFVNNFIGVYQQVRYFPVWFLSALFLADIITYLLLKLSKKFKHDILVSIPIFIVELLLAIGFNFYYQKWLMLNLDASIFGVLFVYLGYLFMQKPMEKIRHYLFLNRYISLLISLILLTIGFLLTKYFIIDIHHTHLEMWAGRYQPYYLILPVAIILSFGVCFLSAAITNKILAQLGLTTLVLLAFHQEFTMKLFSRWFIDYRQSINIYIYNDPNDYHILLYTLAETLFSIALQLPIHYLLAYSPFAFIINKKMPQFYKDKFQLIKNKITEKIKNQPKTGT